MNVVFLFSSDGKKSHLLIWVPFKASQFIQWLSTPRVLIFLLHIFSLYIIPYLISKHCCGENLNELSLYNVSCYLQELLAAECFVHLK